MRDPAQDPQLPLGLTRVGSSRTFTLETLPAALQEDHSLRAGRWGQFVLEEGSVTFVDLERGEELKLTAPATHPIAPQARHHLRVDGPLTCRIDFYEAPREPNGPVARR
ncbi:MAG: DUF1971 domain-containing protein [Planctomycetes bacterium]|nr:DUF1971 domain-containing protein [Planctomycetota bacterium]